MPTPDPSSGPSDQFAETASFSRTGSPAGERFLILRPHAKGGLGEVSIARDLELNREVALKQIQARFREDAESRQRFLLEAEITGCLEHPGIVPVYALGRDAEGRPFYAMRFIRGDSLQQAADDFHRAVKSESKSDADRSAAFAGIAFRQLMRRFVDVCNAVEYAHSRGVLHRDLKPGNVMLGRYGETLVVDWGLAKVSGNSDSSRATGEPAVTPSTSGDSTPTQMGVAIGTPSYMSPEAARGALDLLGPASDVYSLGATLYYLLAGDPPFGKMSGERHDLGDLLRRVQRGDFDPVRQKNRNAPAALAAICDKAMALAPENRYATVRDLADEVERFLADEPVAAFPEPLAQRLRRRLRRHPKAVASLAAAIVVGLAGASAIAAVVAGKNEQLASVNGQLDVANRELSGKNELLAKAVQAEKQASQAAEARRKEAVKLEEQERLARQEADARRADAEAVLKFFEDRVLSAARPANQAGGLGFDATIRAAIDAAEPQIDPAFRDRPLVEASLRTVLGNTYWYAGDAARAVPQHRRARELRLPLLGASHPDTLSTTASLALALHSSGALDEALPLYEETLRIRRETLGEDHPDTSTSMNNLAGAYDSAGKPELSLPLYEKALELRKAHYGLKHARTLMSMNNLGLAYRELGQLAKAVALLEETLDLRKKVLGDDHPETAQSLVNLALAYNSAGRKDEALALYEQGHDVKLAKFGPEHPETLAAISNLAAAYQEHGDLQRARELLETHLTTTKSKYGDDEPESARSLRRLAGVLLAMKESGEAVARFEQSHAIFNTKLGPDHPDTLLTKENLAVALLAVGEYDRALPLLQTRLEAVRKRNNEPHLAAALAAIAKKLLEHERYADAEPMLRECLEIRMRTMSGDWQTASAQSLLGAALAGQEKFTDAEPLLLEGYRGLKEREAAMPAAAKPRLAEAAKSIISLYEKWQKPEEAAKWVETLGESP